MQRYIIKRVLLVIPILIAVSFIVFLIMSLTPGDPATIILGDTATQEDIQKVNDEYGFNNPFFVRYANYMGDILHADSMTVQTFSNSDKKNALVLNRCAMMPCLASGGVDKIKHYAEMLSRSNTPEADYRRLQHNIKRLRQLLDDKSLNNEAYWAERNMLLAAKHAGI